MLKSVNLTKYEKIEIGENALQLPNDIAVRVHSANTWHLYRGQSESNASSLKMVLQLCFLPIPSFDHSLSVVVQYSLKICPSTCLVLSSVTAVEG